MTLQAAPTVEKPIDNGLEDTIAPANLKSRTTAYPLLESGDRLSRAEFERRYSAQPEIKKAELIEGVVYVASPVRIRQHAKPHGRIITWLGTYCAATPRIDFSDNGTLRLDMDNEPQPDVCAWIDEQAGGQARIGDDDYLIGVPELVIEVAASSATYDLHDKLNAYRRNGIKEYLVLLPYDQKTIWYIWHEGEYRQLMPDEQGILRSQVFPGLYFQPALFWADDLAGLLVLLQQGINAPEHAAFVAQLASQRNQP